MLELASCLKLGGWSAARYKLTWFVLTCIRSKPAGGKGIVELVYAGWEGRPGPVQEKFVRWRPPTLRSGKAWSFDYSQVFHQDSLRSLLK